jgi:predicted DNA-binding ribbon-helix-helix protein
MQKHSVRIAGHATSITLEAPFWDHLRLIAEKRGQSLSEVITEIDNSRGNTNLSSAIRVFVLADVSKAP